MKRLALKLYDAPGCKLHACVGSGNKLIRYELTNPHGIVSEFRTIAAAKKDARTWYGNNVIKPKEETTT